MNERIKILTEKTVKGEMWVEHVKTEYDRTDLFLSPVKMSGKRVCEYILNGVKKALKFEVITEQPEALSKELIEKLGHSVTVTPAHGMYKNRDKYLLICVIRSRQIGDFEKILKKYPDSFASISDPWARLRMMRSMLTLTLAAISLCAPTQRAKRRL